MLSQVGFIRRLSPNLRAAEVRVVGASLVAHWTYAASGSSAASSSGSSSSASVVSFSSLGDCRGGCQQKRWFSTGEACRGRFAPVHYALPHNRRNKVVSVQDAVSLVSSGDTICSSGFVCQGAPEYLLRHLGECYEEKARPHSLTLLFGGGPGDYSHRGLNHLAKTKPNDPSLPPMLKRTIGAHYGQTPMIAELALKNELEAHVLPMGSVSRMIRAQSSHSPGHITTVGLGTFLDPETGTGGALNELAEESELHEDLITKVQLQGHDYLMYKALPIDVAIIRATTGDSMGNLTVEDESLLADQMIMAAAARNSSGIVIAQVKRLAAPGSLRTRDVKIPGPMVDCVVVVPDELHAQDHPMSYLTVDDPVLTGQIRTPVDEIPKMPLSDRKVIARRAAMMLQPGKFVNLGIGLPDGVAAVAGEEDLLEYITLTTEPGVIGGIPATGHEFGPARNPDALVEMNQVFDYYNGSGLGICFLGAAEISPKGDVNVSRINKDQLTGPGGFIDITNSTPTVCFMGTFTARGLKIDLPGDGTMQIKKDGKVNKFVSEIFEKTFSADEAMRNGQQVFYITERCVFRRGAKHETLELIEIAPGIDLQKDILDHMDFEPIISKKLKLMDERIFKDEKMNIRDDVFGSLEDRIQYNEDDHLLFMDLFGISLASREDIESFFHSVEEIFSCYSDEGKDPMNVVLNYDGFDLKLGLEDFFGELATEMERKYYKSVKRLAGKAFHRAKLGSSLRITRWDPHKVFNRLDEDNNGYLSAREVRDGVLHMLNLKLSQEEVKEFLDKQTEGLVSEERFIKKLSKFMKSRGFILDH